MGILVARSVVRIIDDHTQPGGLKLLRNRVSGLTDLRVHGGEQAARYGVRKFSASQSSKLNHL